MVSADEKTLYRQLASQSGRDIAQHFRCSYYGDCDPINHGGFFYDPRDWEAYGYASCVEFWTHPETGELIVRSGVINRVGDFDKCMTYNGITDPIDRENVDIQIECFRWYSGIEPDDYQITRRYNLENWQEWRIWRSVAHLLKQLGQ